MVLVFWEVFEDVPYSLYCFSRDVVFSHCWLHSGARLLVFYAPEECWVGGDLDAAASLPFL